MEPMPRVMKIAAMAEYMAMPGNIILIDICGTFAIDLTVKEASNSNGTANADKLPKIMSTTPNPMSPVFLSLNSTG